MFRDIESTPEALPSGAAVIDITKPFRLEYTAIEQWAVLGDMSSAVPSGFRLGGRIEHVVGDTYMLDAVGHVVQYSWPQRWVYHKAYRAVFKRSWYLRRSLPLRSLPANRPSPRKPLRFRKVLYTRQLAQSNTKALLSSTAGKAHSRYRNAVIHNPRHKRRIPS
jgi:hypothetical protein